MFFRPHMSFPLVLNAYGNCGDLRLATGYCVPLKPVIFSLIVFSPQRGIWRN